MDAKKVVDERKWKSGQIYKYVRKDMNEVRKVSKVEKNKVE